DGQRAAGAGEGADGGDGQRVVGIDVVGQDVAAGRGIAVLDHGIAAVGVGIGDRRVVLSGDGDDEVGIGRRCAVGGRVTKGLRHRIAVVEGVGVGVGVVQRVGIVAGRVDG